MIKMKNRYVRIFLISCATVLLASGVYGAENKDLNEQMKALEKKINKVADIRAVKKLMMQAQQHIDWMNLNVQKTEGQCFGQNEGYIYGNFFKRTGQANSGQGGAQAGQGGASGSQGGAPGGQSGTQGGQGGAPGVQGGASGSAQGGAPGGQGGQGGAPGGQGGGGQGGAMDFHILPTGVVEVAEDGLTAKGVWYSPGMIIQGSGSNISGTWIYETYAMDFVKEDGVWRIWHRTLSTDGMWLPTGSWTDSFGSGPSGTDIARISAIMDSTKDGEYKDDVRQRDAQAGGALVNGQGGASGSAQGGASGGQASGQGGAPGGMDSGSKDIKGVTYRSWTATTVPQYKPIPPSPYKTFDMNYSYCPEEPKDLKIDADKKF
jgi:hypothetical protein